MLKCVEGAFRREKDRALTDVWKLARRTGIPAWRLYRVINGQRKDVTDGEIRAISAELGVDEERFRKELDEASQEQRARDARAS